VAGGTGDVGGSWDLLMAETRRTYWHLGAGRRLPSDYEIATSKLLYHVDRGGFEVQTPAAAFHERYQRGSPLVCERWDAFVDPRATTYTTYVNTERDRESYVGRLLATVEESDHDRKLPPAWIDTLARVLSPLRFLCHGLQMSAAYVGHMAPSGRIAVAAAFQCGDEIRRVQRLAYRVAQLQRLRPGIAETGRALWQSDPGWQPLRRAMERLLVSYDWGEALIALNVCLKPVLDDVYLVRLAALAERAGDHLDAQILRSLSEDCEWHRAWTQAALDLAFADRPSNREVVAGWTRAWETTTRQVERAAAETLGAEGTLDADAPVAGPAAERSHG
jgi:toluene monooxygenase system protein E